MKAPEKVQEDIDRVEAEISEVKSQLNKVLEPDDIQYYRKKEEQLRTKEEQLRAKELLLLQPAGGQASASQDASSEHTFQRLCYAVPTPGSDKPYSRKCFNNIKGSEFRRIIELQGVGAVTTLEEYPFPDPAALEDVQQLSSVNLQEGGTYVLAFDPPTIRQQAVWSLTKLWCHDGHVGELDAWRTRWIAGQEGEGAEKGVRFLKENGHPEAIRKCQKKFRKGELAVQLDGLVVADRCAVVVEAKPILSESYLAEFIIKLDKLRQLVRDGAPGTKILLGKRLLPVMAVRTVTANTAELQPIQDDLRKQEIEVWLPNGVALDTGDGCFTSPHLHFPPAIAQQTAQQTRPGSKSAQASMPMQIVRPGKQRCKVLRHPVITRTSLFAQRPLQMRLRWV